VQHLKDRINAIVVDNQEIVRLGMRIILQSIEGLSVVGEFGDGRTAVEMAPALNPDLIMLDMDLPELDGIQATALLKRRTQAKVIIVTSHQDERDLFAALNAGIDGYCLRGLTPECLISVIECVMGGGLWLDGPVMKIMVNAMRAGRFSPATVLQQEHKLSERELQVLRLVVDGLTNQQIAEQLYVSMETVKTHVRHLMEKMGVFDRTQAAMKALTEGIVAGQFSPSHQIDTTTGKDH
jgi:NarL family two-component system response regulator LiaR